ncbi:hypothetical protein OGAPHI_004285 [Ogataea philodendri]|uniref:Cell division control protein n=1 Tax=Ogataea philodendri TaxID=1378263 RepID=A0A9P8T5M7_9ASCO|nr:uncharacterized protein OGAPHI_004285 [Ogataea philodendri]KAH3666096.1 hypothetical protein OGAPHI_004285 [Ogataea philodendri]
MHHSLSPMSSPSFKRTMDPIEWEIQPKRIKLDQKASANIGLLSPPVTPEKNDRILNIQPGPVKSLNTKLFDTKRPASISVYSKAKELFLRSAELDLDQGYALVSREKEATLLRDRLDHSILNIDSTSIYVSGPPGTGKTAQINAVLSSLVVGDIENAQSSIFKVPVKVGTKRINRKVRISKINCMTVRKSEDIFDAIYNDIQPNADRKKKSPAELKQLLADQSKCDITIIILDEMDNLMGRSQQVLFELFSWASNLAGDNPKIVIIGIANALDLTDRFLPRLKSNNISPDVIPFLPYTAEQIQKVITAKLQSLTDSQTTSVPLIHPAAIQLCARKSATTTGDLRRAFDIVHCALDLTERIQLQRLGTEGLSQLTLADAPKVMIAQLAKVCNTFLSANPNAKLQNLNIQHKTVLCTLIRYDEVLKAQKSKTGASINSFYSFYSSQQEVRKAVGILNRGEFLEVLSSLESDSLVNIASIANTKMHSTSKIKGPISYGDSKLSSSVQKMDALRTVDDIGVLKKILTCTNDQ